MHAITPDECRRWLGVQAGEEPQALIFMGTVDYPQVINAWSGILSDPHTGPFPNLVIGSVGGLRLAIGAGYGAAIAGDLTHACCLLGARVALVTGFFGGLQHGIQYADVLLATRARGLDAVSPQYLEDGAQPDASEDVVRWLRARCEKEGLPYHLGPVVSAASIMTETEEHFREWQAAGFYGVDLEVATVFAIARRFGARRCALLVQSDSPVSGVYLSTQRSGEDRRRLFERAYAASRLALSAASEFAA